MADRPPTRKLDLGQALARLESAAPRRESGRVTEVTGLVVRASVPGVRVGEIVTLEGSGLEAEVVGFRGEEAVLLPLGEAVGIGPDSLVTATGRSLSVEVSDGVLGRVLDGLGARSTAAVPSRALVPWPVDRPAPDPLARRRITAPLALGVRALDALLTVGEGQRVGLFAGSGVGKSTLLGQIARQTEADVNVIALVGERGREVVDFLDESLGETGRKRARSSSAPPATRPAWCGSSRRSSPRRSPSTSAREGRARALLLDSADARGARAARGRPRRR